MGRKLRPLLVALTAGMLFAGISQAGIPDPDFSTVPNVLYSPGATVEYKVYVGSPDGPVQDAVVQVVLSDEAMGFMCLCSGASENIHTATTDASGEAIFFIAGGGCMDPAALTGPPAQVFANGVWLADVGALSPDTVDDNGVFPWQGWDPAGTCAVGLSDATTHTIPIKTGAYSFCTDFNSNGEIDLGDAILITPPISLGESCSQ